MDRHTPSFLLVIWKKKLSLQATRTRIEWNDGPCIDHQALVSANSHQKQIRVSETKVSNVRLQTSESESGAVLLSCVPIPLSAALQVVPHPFHRPYSIDVATQTYTYSATAAAFQTDGHREQEAKMEFKVRN